MKGRQLLAAALILPLFGIAGAGIYFYHGHNWVQRPANLQGSLLVEPAARRQVEPFLCHGELSILLHHDCWHHSTCTHHQELGLFSNFVIRVEEPQSLLIGSCRKYNCSLVPVNASANDANVSVLPGNCVAVNPDCTFYILFVEQGKAYRLRVTSGASLPSVNFTLEGHNLTIVEAGEHCAEPVEVQNMDIYSCESFLSFTANQDPSHNYWVAVTVRGWKPPTSMGVVLLNYLPKSPSTAVPQSPVWNNADLCTVKAKARTGCVEPSSKRPMDRTLQEILPKSKLEKFIKIWPIYGQIVGGLVLAFLMYLGSKLCKVAGRFVKDCWTKTRTDSHRDINGSTEVTQRGHRHLNNTRHDPMSVINPCGYWTRPSGSVNYSIFQYSHTTHTATTCTEIGEEFAVIKF